MTLNIPHFNFWRTEYVNLTEIGQKYNFHCLAIMDGLEQTRCFGKNTCEYFCNNVYHAHNYLAIHYFSSLLILKSDFKINVNKSQPKDMVIIIM